MTEDERAIDYIERLLARAFGHGASEAFLERAAQQINAWADSETWGPDVRKLYAADDHILARYIKADREELELLRDPPLNPGHNSQLTADELLLVVKHWPLVDSEANKIARRDTELHNRLTAVGRAELEKAIRRFDITRNVTFGAFVKPRIRGCMLNYLDRVWNREPEPPRPWADDQGKRWFNGMTRATRSCFRLANWSAPDPKSRLIRGRRSLGMIETALAKLNPRQRTVYRGRVLTDPPVPRATLARQLGIEDETQISRILRQALRLMDEP